jgi:hypothetical protein
VDKITTLDEAVKGIPEGWWWRLGKDTDFYWATAEPWGCATDDPLHVEAAHCRTAVGAILSITAQAQALMADA